MRVERRGCLSSKKVIANRETGMSIYLPRRFVIARWQENGWDEPYKSRGLRTVLWAAGGEIPPVDPAKYLYRAVDKEGKTVDFLLTAKRDKAAAMRFFDKAMRDNDVPEKVTMDKSGANK